MNERQQNLLKIITTKYIKTAQPVGSKLITGFEGFDLSPATIRNEMAELEKAGYIFQPHTSAGRVPTEKGYNYFVDNFLQDSKLVKKQKDFLDQFTKTVKVFESQAAKNLAKNIAELADNAVFIAFSNNDFYYTGLSHLFSQPEFNQHQLVYNLSQIIDHFDQVLNKIFNQVNSEVEILIGHKNPFSADCSSIIGKYQINKQIGLLGILGPQRMDYQNNFNLIQYSRELINNLN